MSFNQFPDYQSLESGSQGSDGKANRSIPDRIKEYNLMYFIKSHFDVLDIGCNRGYFGVVLSPYINSYTGIDSDQNQINEGLKVKPQNSELICTTFKRLDKKFHIILCLAVHSYVGEDMQSFANDLYGMLHDGGFLFIESHPPGYRDEPDKYLKPLITALNKNLFEFEYKEIKDRDLKRELFIFHKGKMGSTSQVTIEGNRVTKQYFGEPYFSERSLDVHFKNASKALSIFNGNKHFPKVRLIDFDNYKVIMDYCGEPVTKLPDDFAQQANVIESIMEREGIYHLDVKKENILIKDGIITLIDWGLSTRNKSEYTKKISEYVQPE